MKKISIHSLAFSIVLILAFVVSFRNDSGKKNTTTRVSAWPRSIPCRVEDSASPDLFMMILGEVETPLAQGMYNPATDKSNFPLPPSGFTAFTKPSLPKSGWLTSPATGAWLSSSWSVTAGCSGKAGSRKRTTGRRWSGH